MTKWISDNSVLCREIPGTRSESYNAISGSPVYNVRLEIPNGQWELARSRLLGTPEAWPHESLIKNVKAISANLVSDSGKYSTDSERQILNPDNPHLIDMMYAPRQGVYVELFVGIDVYVEDILEPRNETHPLNCSNFIWGNTTDTVPNDTMRTLAPAETPVRYEPGDTLTHTIEGWAYNTTGLEAFVGTCNNAPYISASLNRTFATGTLLLKNIQITKQLVFISYRQPFAVVLPLIDFSGLPAPIIKFIYEYKEIGWQRLYRADPDSTLYPEGYYYIRHAKAPYDKFSRFALADHSDWLD